MEKIVALIVDFLDKKIDADEFTDQYVVEWRKTDDDVDYLKKYDGLFDSTLSTIFCMADLYSPDDDREPPEIDAKQLCVAVRALLVLNGFAQGEVDTSILPEGFHDVLNSYYERRSEEKELDPATYKDTRKLLKLKFNSCDGF